VSVSSDVPTVIELRRWPRCPFTCDALFENDSSFDSHMTTFHASILTCNQCEGSLFAGAEALDKHKAATHCFKCPDCSKTFNVPTELSHHVLDEHLWKCEDCPDVRFLTASAPTATRLCHILVPLKPSSVPKTAVIHPNQWSPAPVPAQ
jgi:uncharacterized C2H2 Zn-finger protein